MPEDTDGQPRPVYHERKVPVVETHFLRQARVGINASVRIDPMTSPPYNWIGRLEIDLVLTPFLVVASRSTSLT